MNTPDAPPLTEQIDPRYAELDSWPTAQTVAALYEGQLAAAAAVQSALPAIARAVDDAARALTRGGRLVYVGAGTSGRIGVQDGAELAPTFNWPAERVVFLMAGGMGALVRSIEGAEDSEADGARAVSEAKIGSSDVVIGIAASGTTPYTLGALRAAHDRGAVTVGVANNPGTPLLQAVRHPILVATGSEAIAGSTRMKAGTAQKIVLNLFSTALMVKLGRVFCGLMVHMQATNAKLRQRAKTIVSGIAGCTRADATRHLAAANGEVKLAVLFALRMDGDAAAKALEEHNGNLRAAIGTLAPRRNG